MAPIETARLLPEMQDDDIDVDVAEVIRLIKKRSSRNAAPGPDNIKAMAWKKAPINLLMHIADLYTGCLKEGVFPVSWKKAMLVLIPKGSSVISSEIKARPICLLDEIGKTFERVIADRINDWLDSHEQFSLSSNQYGFRRNRSTIDALLRVHELVNSATSEGGFAIAVGLDISNAFNSVPWNIILEAMRDKSIPTYLCRIVAAYLSSRCIVYRNAKGVEIRREVSAGVPQGSVLGPCSCGTSRSTLFAVDGRGGLLYGMLRR